MDGFHEAIVTNSADPESRGRIRVKIPHMLGNVETGWVSSIFSGSSAPSAGSRVWVTGESGKTDRLIFLDPLGGGAGPTNIDALVARVEELERWSRGESRTLSTHEAAVRVSSGQVSVIAEGRSLEPTHATAKLTSSEHLSMVAEAPLEQTIHPRRSRVTSSTRPATLTPVEPPDDPGAEGWTAWIQVQIGESP